MPSCFDYEMNSALVCYEELCRSGSLLSLTSSSICVILHIAHYHTSEPMEGVAV